MSRILPLDANVISEIQSSKHVPSLRSVVLGLLENSLDAGANKIEILVDFARRGCTVEDNGTGIPASEFLETGGLARMYHTSKHHSESSQQLHGSSGSFLATVAALSLIKIASLNNSGDPQAVLILYQGKVISRDISATSAERSDLVRTCGTRVTVRDLFGNMPVRVKQSALALEGEHRSEKEWQELKRSLVALLLAWPAPCSVRIRDEQNASKMIYLSNLQTAASAALTEKALANLNGTKPKFDLQDALPFLWQSGLTVAETRRRWVPVSATTAGIVVKGSICLQPVPTRKCQFISIGIRPIVSLDGENTIYDSLNKLFINSDFGGTEDDFEVDQAMGERRKYDRRFKTTGFTKSQLQGQKGLDRWPMFVLRINIRNQPQISVDPDRMSDATLKAVHDILSFMITQWLWANHFRPRKQRRKNETQESPAKLNSLVEDCSDIRHGICLTPGNPTSSAMKDGGANTVSSSDNLEKWKSFPRGPGAPHSKEDGSVQVINARDCFRSWSRIKSGRSRFYQDMWDGNKPATAPEGQTGTKVMQNRARPSTAFARSTLEAGTLNDGHSDGRVVVEKARRSRIAPQCPDQMLLDSVSSDDYGSLEDGDILAAIESLHWRNNRLLSNLDPEETASSPVNNESSTDALIEWKDPISERTFKINGRTGGIIPVGEQSVKPQGNANSRSQNSVEENPPPAFADFRGQSGVSLSRRPKSSAPNTDRWLRDFLEGWNNPVFAQQDEPAIPTTSLLDFDANFIATATDNKSQIAGLGTSVSKTLCRAALQHAQFIKQVDRKYLLCTVGASNRGNTGDDTLILIDQHAASERIILEGLLRELCTLNREGKSTSRTLEKALRFDITDIEHEKLEKHRLHFEDWGIVLEVTQRSEVPSEELIRPPRLLYTVIVRCLPPGIAERCSLVPKLVIELLRAEIWALAEKALTAQVLGRPINEEEDGIETHSWLQRIGSCPKGILDMLNSRACRSAVMFNDELTVSECERLISDLSRCAFPFMCAHGRVSMVPIAAMGVAGPGCGSGAILTPESDASHNFTEAFKKWKCRDRSCSDNETNN